ncbi:DUF805 domain-containing protein [Pseudomonadales bacterium]|nr:DUF805 domain-containing protein [Pseudomonadales bacterium]
MSDAVVSVLKNWKNFHGRACRSELWYFTLAVTLISFVIAIVEIATGIVDIESSELEQGILSNIFLLMILIPSFSVTSRRLQDRGISGWWQLSYLIVIGLFVIPLICMFPAKEEENKWGRDPLLEK